MTAMDNYEYTVHWSEDDQEWVGRCDAFPSLSWLAPEQNAALAGIKDLVADGVAVLDSLGRTPKHASGRSR